MAGQREWGRRLMRRVQGGIRTWCHNWYITDDFAISTMVTMKTATMSKIGASREEAGVYRKRKLVFGIDEGLLHLFIVVVDIERVPSMCDVIDFLFSQRLLSKLGKIAD
jgi:hypothetical protein